MIQPPQGIAAALPESVCAEIGFGGCGGATVSGPVPAAGACVIGIVVCVVDPEFGLLCECDDVPFEDGCDTDREGVERGVVELLVGENCD